MIALDVDRVNLIISLDGMNAVFALRRRIVLPRGAIELITPAPEALSRRPPGFRLPGSWLPFWPGPVTAGTSVSPEGTSFWSLVRAMPEEVLRIDAIPGDGQPFRALVLQVPNAAATARDLTRALWSNA